MISVNEIQKASDVVGFIKELDFSLLPSLPVSASVEYRHIPGFFGYCVGSDGTIWSAMVPNKKSRRYTTEWHQKKKWQNVDGYYIVCLWDDHGHERRLLAHTAILTTFVGPRPKGCDTLHGNGDPSDNRLENLRWGTRKENMQDARQHGTLLTRERNRLAKLTELKAKAARELLQSGWPQRDVANILGVSQGTICGINTGKRWSELA